MSSVSGLKARPHSANTPPAQVVAKARHHLVDQAQLLALIGGFHGGQQPQFHALIPAAADQGIDVLGKAGTAKADPGEAGNDGRSARPDPSPVRPR